MWKFGSAVKHSAGWERQYSTARRTSTPPRRKSTLIGRILWSRSRPLTYSAPAGPAATCRMTSLPVTPLGRWLAQSDIQRSSVAPLTMPLTLSS
jgi:hypothetical protein